MKCYNISECKLKLVSLFFNVLEYFKHNFDDNLLLYFFMYCYMTSNIVDITYMFFNKNFSSNVLKNYQILIKLSLLTFFHWRFLFKMWQKSSFCCMKWNNKILIKFKKVMYFIVLSIKNLICHLKIILI
jgi:hypothetical protein